MYAIFISGAVVSALCFISALLCYLFYRRSVRQRARMESLFRIHLAHEIRNPLNAMGGLIWMLRQSALNEEQERYVRALQGEADSILHAVKNTSDLSQMLGRQLKLQNREFPLWQTLEDAIKPVQALAALRHINIAVTKDESLYPLAYGDPGRTAQIVHDLVDMAVRFSAKETVTVSATKENLEWIISISDNGLAEAREKLLAEPLSLHSLMDKNATKITVVTIRMLVEHMGGRIGSSRSAGGYTVWFSLPPKESLPAGRARPKWLPKFNSTALLDALLLR